MAAALAPSLVVDPGEIRLLGPQNITAAEVITVRGMLRCHVNGTETATTTLRARQLVVEAGGTFECGTVAAPMTNIVDIQLLQPEAAGGPAGISVHAGGTLHLHGDSRRATRARLARVAAAGTNHLVLRPPGVGGAWEVGDLIIITTTSFHRQPATAQVHQQAQNEERFISAMSTDGLVVHLHRPVAYDHHGGWPATFNGSNLTLDEAGHVANLRRSIRLAPANRSWRGGHVIVHRDAGAFVSAVELTRLGNEGILGQYPFHWHRAADVSGQYIRNSSVHHTAQRCIVVHSTTGAAVEGNTSASILLATAYSSRIMIW